MILRSPSVQYGFGLEAVWIVLSAIAVSSPASAQLVPDATLGSESSIVAPVDASSDRIDGGALRGGNLFHSFSQFNVGEGRSVIFSNPTGIDRILTRVTGDSISQIFGTLGAGGGADLFLLNPNGIVFGPDASLDVRGAFVGSTGNAIAFADGFEFDTNSVGAVREPPLLTVSVPVGLQLTSNSGEIAVLGTGNRQIFAGDSPEAQQLFDEIRTTSPSVNIATLQQSEATLGIASNGAGVTVPAGGSVTLVGENVSLQGGRLRVPGGDVTLASIIEGDFNLETETIAGSRGDIILSEGAAIDTSGSSSGNVNLFGSNILVSDGSVIFARPRGSGTGSQIAIDATQTLILSGVNPIDSQGSGIMGGTLGGAGGSNIEIRAGTVSVGDGGFLSSITFSTGSGGDIEIDAIDVEIADSFSGIFADTWGSGSGGTLQIESDRLLVSGGSQLSAGTFRSGPGGSIQVRAAESVELTGSIAATDSAYVRDLSGTRFPSGLFVPIGLSATDAQMATGNGGTIAVETGQLRILDGAGLGSATFDRGSGGNIEIVATDSVELRGTDAAGSGSFLSSGLAVGAEADVAGDITIDTGRFLVSGGAFVRSGTLGRGDSGNLTIRASNSVELVGLPSAEFTELAGLGSNGTIVAGVGETGEGDAGNITIETGQLILREAASISSSTLGNGNAGDVRVQATESVTLQGVNAEDNSSSIVSQNEDGRGNAGNITIDTGRLLLEEGAFISSSTFGEGNAGSLTVLASESVILQGTSDGGFASSLGSQTNSGSRGDASDLTIETGRLVLDDGAFVSAQTRGEGNGGSLTIRASESVTLQGVDGGGAGSLIQTRVRDSAIGNAGDLNIDTQRLSLDDMAAIASSTEGIGNAGNLTIAASESVDLTGESTISARTDGGGTAGNLTIVADRVQLRDRSQIVVSGEGDFSAGTLTIAAPFLQLDNRGQLSANTQAGDGGNIVVRSSDLRLRRHSTISTNAIRNATGGNIDIATDTLTALENSDISANAELGSGGQIRIQATGIFGTQFRPRTTPESDITASSQRGAEFSGIVEIQTPDVDPGSGLVDLRSDIINAAALIDSDPCVSGNDSEFVITGRGGLPPHPTDPVSASPTAIGWEDFRQRDNETVTVSPSPSLPLSLSLPREATNWTIAPDGSVSLIAEVPTRVVLGAPSCR